MRSLLKCFTISSALFLVQCEDSDALEKKDNVTLKAPILATPSQHWEGVDGTWSTFEIRVGTPETTYRVLPITSWQETWVVYGAAAGVCNTSVGVSANCNDARGGVFDSAKSSTWEQGDQYTLGLNDALGYSGVGQYGFDTVGLGYNNKTGITLPHQIVAEIVSDSWWFGALALGFQPTNFSGYGNPQASFSDTLYSNGSISSKSWAYTAGAYYRLKGVFGSLTFGGYDASRFTPNDVFFTMSGDNLRDIVVTVRSITSTISSGNTTLMSTPEFAFIDSAVPELWLPTTVCQAFEKAFGLTLDPISGLYLLNASTHANLLQMNPNITIKLANEKSAGKSVDIVLPYAAFDLNVTSPKITNSTSYYFPLRPTSDNTKYTLGRTFLQEVYVSTHYNSHTFNVSQCIFSDTASPSIVALPALPLTIVSPPRTSTLPTDTSSSSAHKISGGAIAGIVIGILIFLFILAILLFILFILSRRRKPQRANAAETETGEQQDPVHEIDAGRRIDPQSVSAYREQASRFTSEVDGKDARVEKWGIPVMVPQELEADIPRERLPSHEDGNEGMSGDKYSSDLKGGEIIGATRRGVLTPVKEHHAAKIPAAEMDARERERVLGEGQQREKGGEEEREVEEGEEHIVSPNTDTMPSIMGRKKRSGRTTGGEDGSPTLSEGTWTPSTPVPRRGSRFEERL